MANNSNTTQALLPFAEIRDDCVVMRDATLRSVLLVSSINFALKGPDEQNAIIYGYISFLNSLNFPLQIIIQSRPLIIDGYLSNLKKLEKEQTNDLLRQQIADYHDFLKELLGMGQIMTKKFYVSVPFVGIKKQKKKFFERLTDAFSSASILKMSEKRFAEFRDELQKRIELVASGLTSLGLQVVQLDTQSLVELLYNTYNPELAGTQIMAQTQDLRIEN